MTRSTRSLKALAALAVTGAVATALLLSGAGSAAAHTPSEDGTPTCAAPLDGSWIAHFTVHNDPNPSFGAAEITGTGTSLDGRHLSAGGGTASIDLPQAAGTPSVTVAGTLTWPKDRFSAGFSWTETMPPTCAAPPTTPPVSTPPPTTPPPPSSPPVTPPTTPSSTPPVTHSPTPPPSHASSSQAASSSHASTPPASSPASPSLTPSRAHLAAAPVHHSTPPLASTGVRSALILAIAGAALLCIGASLLLLGRNRGHR